MSNSNVLLKLSKLFCPILNREAISFLFSL